MATGIGLMCISTTPLNCITLKTPPFGITLVALDLVLAVFYPILRLKIISWLPSYHGNKGRFEANFDDAVKLPEPE